MILCFSTARRSLAALPFIAQLLDITVYFGSTAPAPFAKTAQARGGIFGFRPENDLVFFYDGGQLVAGF